MYKNETQWNNAGENLSKTAQQAFIRHNIEFNELL